ncbi:succinate dehydrogenase/fumarate reductase iron-sulfur subunit [Prosthecochloris sp. N3]|uniref:Succinate dehydrogenase/fumarate reductase iron-sulfur subunit n=1 Tax=Prosthecochloris ethylica TaxID=2743976 RepID=A0ABR9XQX9_9CHLB|nr:MULTISPECIES: succinate dehydrogenase/fumarate reductase iron-sulfur subunit [Prosthecochloris]MEC9486162.1 succinate dehydrogenase/fumarate reductase iron-sulfur subunit [Prosthecochloris sp.]MBF0586398.1 succinate dehydrogenase/fumarate reductase iron-sulfur subunit [Prosthecochloris ethylica]MBF0636384.1 succinate dehydrogenase/fumarate reductase iron-sulfur subunit [Prosthecochloris ethylica]NUK47558.1 succinate dehydrogenase/fumarate reductase iron-sulfur subunit [Prosthecochloris ethyl
MGEHKEEMRDVTFRVLRFNPQVDNKPYFDDYTIPVEKGITVLRALNYIKEQVDPTVSFRAFCQAGICGSCGMRINGISKLACTTQVWDELEKCKVPDVIKVEPLRNMPHIKDLIVDMDPMVDKMKKYSNWVESTMPESKMGEKEFLISEEEFKEYDKSTDCILCASCMSECSILRANKEYVAPAILLKSHRMNVDSRDGIHDKRMAELVKDHGVWDCTHCYRCQETCVKSIPIMDAIHGIREEAIAERGVRDTSGARHAEAFMEDIAKKGKLVEATLPVRTNGLGWTLKNLLPMAFKMVMKRRTPPPPPLVKASKGIRKFREEFNEMTSRVKREQKDHKK